MAEDDLISGAEVPSDTPPVGSSPPSNEQTGGDGGDKPLSLREELVKNLNEYREPKELRAKPNDLVLQRSTDKAPGTSDIRPRDAEGKFIPKEEAPKKTVEAQKAAPVETAPKQDVHPTAASTPPGLPPGWSPETKAFVSALPPDHPLRKDVDKREREVSDGFKKYSEDAKRYSEIEQVLAPVRQTFQQAGVQSDAEAIKRLLFWEGSFRNPQTRMQAFQGLARQYGVDLASLAQSPGSNQTPTDVAPQYQLQEAIQPYLAPIHQAFQSMQSERAQSEISAFSKDKPHFETVRTEMGKLIAQGAAADLDSAYQMATWNNPQIRQELINKEVADKLAASQQDQQAQVQRSKNAKAAAISPSQRAPAAPPLNSGKKPAGVRGSIMSAIDEIRENRA